MQNEEIKKYEFQLSNLSCYSPIEIPVQSSSGISKFKILAHKISSPDICIITSIGRYSLNRYLFLDVDYEDGMFFVENREFNLWGEGDSLDHAINSFKDFFLYDLKSYLNTPENKMDYFARQELKKYKSIIT
jgi:hypothetical protein